MMLVPNSPDEAPTCHRAPTGSFRPSNSRCSMPQNGRTGTVGRRWRRPAPVVHDRLLSGVSISPRSYLPRLRPSAVEAGGGTHGPEPSSPSTSARVASRSHLVAVFAEPVSQGRRRHLSTKRSMFSRCFGAYHVRPIYGPATPGMVAQHVGKIPILYPSVDLALRILCRQAWRYIEECLSRCARYCC
jgi:hypothetical protein